MTLSSAAPPDRSLTRSPEVTACRGRDLAPRVNQSLPRCYLTAPLFRSAAGRTGALTEKPMNRIDAWRMIQRRAEGLGFRVKIGCHTFRATGITAYLEAGGTLENAQAMAAHESPRTTKLYDRTGDEITLDEVRITI
jgi:integrase